MNAYVLGKTGLILGTYKHYIQIDLTGVRSV